MTDAWPTIWTGPLLTLGVIPVLYVLYLAAALRTSEGVSLRLWAVTINWMAYHASPFFAYFFGMTWTSMSFDMADKYIDCGLLFSTLCSLATLAGYSLTCHKATRRRAMRAMSLQEVRVYPRAIVFLCLAYVAFFVISVGGIGQVWVSDQVRGTYQWQEMDLWWRITQVFRILCSLASPAVAALATIYALQGESRNRLTRWTFAWSAIFIATLDAAHEFSRISGLPFIIAGALIINIRGVRAWRLSALAISIGIYFGMVGLTQRLHYDMGLGNYASAFVSAWRLDGGDAGTAFDLGAINPVRAMERFTVKVEIKDVDRPQLLPTAASFFWNLHPFPSVLVPLSELGQEPTDYLGLAGISAVPSPAYGDLYYVFGYAGCGFALVMGAIYGWFDQLRARQPGLMSSICYFLCIAAVGASTHAGCRPWTRFTFYALIVYVAATLLTGRSKRQMGPQSSTISTSRTGVARPAVSLYERQLPTRSKI